MTDYQCVYCRLKHRAVGELLFHERCCDFKPYVIATWQREMSPDQRAQYRAARAPEYGGSDLAFIPRRSHDQS